LELAFHHRQSCSLQVGKVLQKKRRTRTLRSALRRYVSKPLIREPVNSSTPSSSLENKLEGRIIIARWKYPVLPPRNHNFVATVKNRKLCCMRSTNQHTSTMTSYKRCPHIVHKEALRNTKSRRITRSVTAKELAIQRNELFDKVVDPVLSSGYLRWYEAENLSRVTKSSRMVWLDQRESYADWSTLLRELNAMNCTNRCPSCEQGIQLKANRHFCSIDKWNKESAKRSPDFHGVVDLVMSTGVLTWREKGSIRRISKTCYKVHREQCTCRLVEPRACLGPFIRHDPRFSDDFDKWSDYQKCKALHGYTKWMIHNLHSFYNFNRVTDPSRLPPGLDGWAWFDIQMVTLQRACPRRYAFVMNMVSLYIAQGELQRSPPRWYATAFLGERHDPAHGSSYEDSLGAGITEYCLPATDDILTKFLRTKCYPSKECRTIVGPLVRSLSIFAPFMDMVPLDPKQRTRLPSSLERLTEEMIDSMSLHFFCTIS
jgi:hypothetical protein